MTERDLKAVLWTEDEIRAEHFHRLNDSNWNAERVFGSSLWIVNDADGRLVAAPQPRPCFPSA